jgi:hypothetical protein
MTSKQFDHGPDPAMLLANSERMIAYELSGSSPRTWRLQLGVDFQPSKYSVICGRGKVSYGHTGNHRLRKLVSMFVEDYAATDCKQHRSTIVSHVVGMTRKGGGRFCKYEQGTWFEVGDEFAREKVSAMFRDMLHTQYRSSAKAKTASRRVQVERNKTQTLQQHSQQLIGGNGHSDDSSMSSSRLGSSTDSLGFDYSLEVDYSLELDFFSI